MGTLTHKVDNPGDLSDVIAASGSTPNTNVIKAQGGLGSKFSVGASLIKGTRGPGESPLEDVDQIMKRQEALEQTFLAAIRKSTHGDLLDVCKGISSLFGGPLGMMIESNPTYQMQQWAKQLDKSFTTTSPLGTGLVPFDLMAPTMLLYPVYTPLRNRIPRPQGQGLSHRAKVMTAITGSRPSRYGNAAQRMSISELPAGGSLSGANWPNQLPGSGTQTTVDLNIPYKFFGLTEAVTWLAQFAGQGFDDIAALASLVLLQEFMMGEERAMIGATTKNLAIPAKAVKLLARTTASRKLTGVTGGKIYVYVTALNYYGETAAVTSTTITVGSTTVIDIQLPSNSAGRLVQNVYVATGVSNPGISGAHLMFADVGASLLTLQGAVPATGPTPPTADTGTGSTTDYEGMYSILSGKAGVDGIYPTGYKAGFYTAASGSELGITVLANALQQVYNGSSTSFFADPSEVWCEASDAKRLSESLATQSDINYTIFIQQDQVANAIAGVAVSQFANPVTRSTVRITVHPYWPQGSVAGVSYTLPQVQTNISNVWENVEVQDYISINWPVIDVTFRYSLFSYGTFFCPAPQYNFLLEGLQKSAVTPYS